MKLLRTGIIGCALILQCVTCWAVYGVRISDLSNSPTPPNPTRVWGKVTSESPVKINDGRAEITVSGLTASLGEYLAVTGDWNGTVLTVNGGITRYVGPAGTEMIYIPAGSFLMGNSNVGNDAVYHYAEELPQHSVSLAAYYIGKYEVTRGEYRAFITAGGYSNSSYWSSAGWTWKGSKTQPQIYWVDPVNWGSPPGSFSQGDSRPVVGVTYYEAEAFCNWAGGHLPTEAQWERAARWTGTHPNVYPWGDTWDVQKCNNWSDSLYPGYQTSPVGSYSSYGSPSGCQDMAGNVWEWCKDWYGETYYSTSPSIDPQGPASGSYRVLRGGSWLSYHPGGSGRCACRGTAHPRDYDSDLGFRLAR